MNNVQFENMDNTQLPESIKDRHKEAEAIINEALQNIYRNIETEDLSTSNEVNYVDNTLALDEKIDKISKDLDDLLADLI